MGIDSNIHAVDPYLFRRLFVDSARNNQTDINSRIRTRY